MDVYRRLAQGSHLNINLEFCCKWRKIFGSVKCHTASLIALLANRFKFYVNPLKKILAALFAQYLCVQLAKNFSFGIEVVKLQVPLLKILTFRISFVWLIYNVIPNSIFIKVWVFDIPFPNHDSSCWRWSTTARKIITIRKIQMQDGQYRIVHYFEYIRNYFFRIWNFEYFENKIH